MKTPPLLPTLATMALALACAALMVIADAARAHPPTQATPCSAQLQ